MTIPWIGRSMILSSICRGRLLETYSGRRAGWLYTMQFPHIRDAGGPRTTWPRFCVWLFATLVLRLCIL